MSSARGDTVPYTSANGHMFSNLIRDGKLALRLPENMREAFLARYKTKLVTEHGVVRKEYVEVPDALLARTTELTPYFAQSLAYVSAMKPKPTRKPQAKLTRKPQAKLGARGPLPAVDDRRAAARPNTSS
ncbi:MAG TPA: hypothetical protein VHN14_16185 [Kofleriaceae bacterium]|nr:hypothetical protein [Kofleriaceae bacterium]